MNHTVVIIIITVLVSLVAWQSPKLMHRLIFYPPAIRGGQIDRFITSGFVHADPIHLIFNMFTLYFFGRVMENLYVDKFGYLGFLSFYVLAIIVSSVPDYVKHKNDPYFRSLGASGGVSAVLFAFILLAPWSVIYFFFIPIPAIIFAILYVAYSWYAHKKGDSNIGHLAHLTGAAFGVVATIAIEPAIVIHFIGALLNPKFDF